MDQGHTVFLPGENFGKIGQRADWTWKQYIRHDLEFVKACDSIYMMQGYKKSRGAKIELFLAKRWGKKVIYEEFEPNITLGEEG